MRGAIRAASLFVMRGASIVRPLCAIILTIFSAMPGQAFSNTLTKADAEVISHLVSRSQQIGSDLTDTGKGMLMASPTTMHCIEQLASYVSRTQSELFYVYLLVVTTLLMTNELDEAFALDNAKQGLDGLSGDIAWSRKSTNYTAGACQSSALIGVKSQKVLDFLDDATKILRQISDRIGRRTGAKE
jgi:hypothetical protein